MQEIMPYGAREQLRLEALREVDAWLAANEAEYFEKFTDPYCSARRLWRSVRSNPHADRQSILRLMEVMG